MASVRVLDAAQVKQLLAPDRLRTRLEEAMAGLSAGRADVPPRVAARAPNGLLAAMPGYLDGVGLAAKLVSIFPNNSDMPSHQGLIALFSIETGSPLAILDAEVITEARTAMTAAIATDLLARPDATILTIVGGGAQARAHVEAFASLRPWTEVRIVNRTLSGAEDVARRARGAGLTGARAVADGGEAVAEADVVALCTHAEDAVIDPATLRPGCHVSSVGSMAELPTSLATADVVVVEWRDSVVVPPPAGAAELQGLSPDQVIELGDLIAGRAIGRRDDTQISVYKSTGHAVQDVATARLVYDEAVKADVGITIEL